MKTKKRNGIRLGLVAGLFAGGLVGVTSLTASGSGSASMVPYGTLSLGLTDRAGSLTLVRDQTFGGGTFTQTLTTGEPCSTLIGGPVVPTGTGTGNLLNFSAAGGSSPNVQLPSDGIGVTDGANCGVPAGLVGPGETLTLDLGGFLPTDVIVSTGTLRIGKSSGSDGNLRVAYDGSSTFVNPVSGSGNLPVGVTPVTVTQTDGFQSISIRSTANQSSRGLSLRSNTVFTLMAPAPATVPDAPTGVTATGGNAQALVSWTAPAFDGGSTITGYELQYSTDDGNTWNPEPPLTATSGGAVTNLDNGTEYIFRVRAVNSEGSGEWSAPSNAVTPATVPDAPTNVIAAGDNARANVSWTAPAFDGGSDITGYELQYSTDDGNTWNPETPLTATSGGAVTDLDNGTEYIFRVRAVNSEGSGEWSAPSNAVTPATVPDAPTNVIAAGDNARANVSWTAPAFDGGSDITGYELQYSTDDGNTWNPETPLTATSGGAVTDLDNGTEYIFRVRAVNSEGSGEWSAPSNAVTPATAPGAPTNLTVVGGAVKTTVSWTAPADDGGLPPVTYQLQYTSDTSATPISVTVDPATATTQDVTGLAPGTYVFQVRAVTEGGSSVPVTSDPVTIVALPVDCGGTVVANGEEGDIATKVTFLRGENQDKPGAGVATDCLEVDATVKIVTGDDDAPQASDYVFWDNTFEDINGDIQRVNATVTIDWAPVAPADAALLDRFIDYDGPSGPAPYRETLWCESFQQISEIPVVYSAVLPDWTYTDGTDGAITVGDELKAPWCLVSDTRVQKGGEIFQTEILFGSGDPSRTSSFR